MANEGARLAALRRYKILDTDPERQFDDLVLIASQICGAPIALITLVDADRQWFKARVGLSLTETERSISICSRAIEQEGLFVVPDALGDQRFRDNPTVTGDPHIRFYAGAPLISDDGQALGTLCVLDHVPRTLTRAQTEALQALRRQVEAQLELRRNLLDLKEALAERDPSEAGSDALVQTFQSALSNVSHLSALMPYISTCQFNVVIQADANAIPTIGDAVKDMLVARGWPEADVMRVELALMEALANAIRHGCKSNPDKHLQCVVTLDAAGDVAIVVRDPGAGFDPSAVPDPLHPDNILKSSGRGIFLINELMDEVSFADDGRELRMRKRRPT